MSDYRFDMNEALELSEQIQHVSQRLQQQDQEELQLQHQQTAAGYTPQQQHQHQFTPPHQWGVASQEQVYSPFVSSVQSPFASTSAGGGTPAPTPTPTIISQGLPPTPSEESYLEAHVMGVGPPLSSEGTMETAPLQLIQITPAVQTATYPQVMLHHPQHESAPAPPMAYPRPHVSPLQTQGLFSPSLQQQGYQVYVSPPQQQYQPMQDVYQPQSSQQTHQLQYNPQQPGQSAFALPATPTQPYPYASPQPSVPMGTHVIAEQQRPLTVPGTGGPVRGGTGRASRAEAALPYARPAHLAAASPAASGTSSASDSAPRRIGSFLQASSGGVAKEPTPAKGKGRAHAATATARPSRSKKQSLFATTTSVTPNTTVSTPTVPERRNLSPIAVREIAPAPQAQSSARPQTRPQPIAHSPTTPSPLGRSVIGLEAVSSTDAVQIRSPASPSMLRDRSPISSTDTARPALAVRTAAADDIRLSSIVRPQSALATPATSSGRIRIPNVTRQRPIPTSPTSGSHSSPEKRSVATQTARTMVNERLSQSPSVADRSHTSSYRPYPSPYTQRASQRSQRDSHPTQPAFRQIPMDTKYYYKTNTLKASLEVPGVQRKDLRVSLGTVFFNRIKYLCILAKSTSVFGDEDEGDEVVNITHGAASSQSAREAPVALDPIGSRQEEEESSQESKIEALEEEENEEEAALGLPPAEGNSQATAQNYPSTTTSATSMVRIASASKPTNPAGKATLSTATTSTTRPPWAPGTSNSHVLTSPVLPLPRPPPIPTRNSTPMMKRKREADDDGSADNDRYRRAHFAEASLFGIPKPGMGRLIGLERRERRFGVSRAVIQVPAATTVSFPSLLFYTPLPTTQPRLQKMSFGAFVLLLCSAATRSCVGKQGFDCHVLSPFSIFVVNAICFIAALPDPNIDCNINIDPSTLPPASTAMLRFLMQSLGNTVPSCPVCLHARTGG